MQPKFKEDIDKLLAINCAISDYCIEFTNRNLADDPKMRSVQMETMIPHFKNIRVDSELYHSKGKISKLRQILNSIEQEASEDIQMENYVLKLTGINLGMKERYYKRLNKLIKRGKLKTDQEYHMIMDQINLLCQQERKDDDMIDKLNKLVLSYESKHT